MKLSNNEGLCLWVTIKLKHASSLLLPFRKVTNSCDGAVFHRSRFFANNESTGCRILSSLWSLTEVISFFLFYAIVMMSLFTYCERFFPTAFSPSSFPLSNHLDLGYFFTAIRSGR